MSGEPDTELVKYAQKVLAEVLFSGEEDYPLQETLDRYFTLTSGVER